MLVDKKDIGSLWRKLNVVKERQDLFVKTIMEAFMRHITTSLLMYLIIRIACSSIYGATIMQDGQYLRPSDPAYEQVLDSLAMVARHTPVPLLEALLRWRERFLFFQ